MINIFRLYFIKLHIYRIESKIVLFISLYFIPLISSSNLAWAAEAEQTMGTTLVRLSKIFPKVMNFISALTIIVGIFLIFMALVKLKHLADFRNMMQGQQDVGKSIFMMILGGIFIWMPFILEAFTVSLFGMGIAGVQNRYPVVGASDGSIVAFFRLMQVVGLISFIRGWFMLVGQAKGQQQPGNVGKALTHIISGVFLFHLMGVIAILDNTLGTSMASFFR